MNNYSNLSYGKLIINRTIVTNIKALSSDHEAEDRQ